MQSNFKKKILLIGPRLHTNYVGQIQSLVKNNYEVHFLAKKKNEGENHTYVKPVILEESKFSKYRKKIFGYIGSNNVQYLPNIIKFISYIKKIRPNHAIIRVHSRLFIYFCAFILRLYKCKIIFYDQFDISNPKFTLLRKIENFLCFRLFDIKMISPICSNKKNIQKNFFFIPFCTTVIKKKKFSKNKIKIISIGKYQKRKNHFLLIDALAEIIKTSNLKLELHFLGELQNTEQKHYKKKIIKYIKHKKLKKFIKIHDFIKHRNMSSFYQKFDIFVLPASNEPASVCVVEALGNGLPVICSDDCGTKHYININYNGLIFKKNDLNSLKKKIIHLSDKKRIKKFSLNAFEFSKKNITKKKFFSLVSQILN